MTRRRKSRRHRRGNATTARRSSIQPCSGWLDPERDFGPVPGDGDRSGRPGRPVAADRQRNPQWAAFEHAWSSRGRTNLRKLCGPSRFDILSESLRCDQGARPATDFYAANREAMDSGFIVSWPRSWKQKRPVRAACDEPAFPAGEAAFRLVSERTIAARCVRDHRCRFAPR